MFGVKMLAQFHFRLDLSCRGWQHARLDSQARDQESAGNWS
jgi:hypothetical protein